MVYEVFLQNVLDALKERLSDDYTVILRRIPKNNGVLLDGLCISRSEEVIAPTIYLNSYYRGYEKGMTLETILDNIMFLYEENSIPPHMNFDQLTDFSLLKNQVAYKLIQADSNKEFLADLPHILYLDLAIVFYLFLDENKTGQMTAIVHNEHLKIWNISVEELYSAAKKNTPLLLPAQIKSMLDVMKEFAKENLGDDYKEEFLDDLVQDDPELSPIFVLSNSTNFNGACCLLYPNQLKNFADALNRDLVILPSSIHEVLLVPDGNNICYEELREMVAHINDFEVPIEDRLSNQIYLYSKASDKISIISNTSVLLS